jgi:hypothetical protein
MAVVGLLSGLSAGTVSGNAGGAARHHEFKGEVVHVDHKHHTFTVKVHHHVWGRAHHAEHKFHVTNHTHFDVVGNGKGHQATFAALHHGEHVVVHTANGHPHQATRVDIHKHHATATKGARK